MATLFGIAGACLTIAAATIAPSFVIAAAGIMLLVAAYAEHTTPQKIAARRARARRGYLR